MTPVIRTLWGMTVFNSNTESSNKVLMNYSFRGDAQLLLKDLEKCIIVKDSGVQPVLFNKKKD